MSGKIKYLTILLTSSLLLHTSCRENSVLKPSDFAMLQTIAEENHVTGMTVLGYKDGATRFTYNYGYSDIERKIKVDDNTIFFMASVSKIITGIAILKLVESGAIRSIEDDVSRYLGYTVRNPKYPERPVTIRHLMTHTSGISDAGISYQFISASYSASPPSMKELFTRTSRYYNRNIWLSSPPGEKFEYSNFATVLAGAIVGKVSGIRFDEFVNEEILSPLGMRGGFTMQHVKNINRVAVVYGFDERMSPYARSDNYAGQKPAPIDFSDYIPGTNPTVTGPHGGLRTQAKGLAKIMEALINGGVYKSREDSVRILKESTVDLMLKTQWQGYGFNGLYRQKGLYIHITDDLVPGIRMYGHMGDALGLISAMYFSPEKKSGIIFVMNGGDHNVGKSGFYKIQEQIFREGYGILSVSKTAPAAE